jgi:hypothetical protein
VALEAHALLVHPPQVREAEDLVAAAVCEVRAVPAGEAVQPAQLRDQRVAGPEHQVVGVGEQHARAQLAQVALQHRLDRARGAHRHERRRGHLPVRRAQQPGARAPVARHELERVHGAGV